MKKKKRKKYKPDGNIFVSKPKYYHQLLPKNLEQGFTTNLVYSLNQNISKQIVSGIIELLMIRDLFIYTFISSLRYLGKNRTRNISNEYVYWYISTYRNNACFERNRVQTVNWPTTVLQTKSHKVPTV